jgi:xylulokinase
MADPSQDGGCVLVIDLGTSYFKTAILDASGDILCIDRTPTPLCRADGWSTIDPAEFFRTVGDAIRRLAACAPDAAQRLRGITFCTQANTFVLLDTDDRPVTPLIVWNDLRAVGSPTEALSRRLATPEHRSRSGLPGLSAYMAIAKLEWLRTTDPGSYARARRLLFIGDYFAFWLTGKHVTDPSVAALSGLFDIGEGAWEPDWCDRAGVDAGWLPSVVAAGTGIGTIRPEVAAELGLPVGATVVAGLLDQYAGAIGVGNARLGDVSETTGTVLATIRASASCVPRPGSNALVGPAPWPGGFYHMAVGDVSASLLDLYRRHLPDAPTFEQLDASAAGARSSLRLDPGVPAETLRATIRDWAGREDRGAVVAAVYRAVAESLRDQVTSLSDERPACVRSAGGASRSRRWLQVKADVVGVPIVEPARPEPTLVGAAALAAAAIGLPPIGGREVDASRWIWPTELRR